MSRFINQNTERYLEPQKKGTSKGDPVGFSKIKHTASFLMIMDFKEREIADMLDMPVGVLRNWLTQTPFKTAVWGNCRRFAEYMFSDIEARIEHKMPIRQKDKKTDIDKIRNDFRELWDSHIYSECVAENVLTLLSDRVTTLMKELKKHRGEHILEKIVSTLMLFRIFIDYLFTPPTLDLWYNF